MLNKRDDYRAESPRGLAQTKNIQRAVGVGDDDMPAILAKATPWIGKHSSHVFFIAPVAASQTMSWQSSPATTNVWPSAANAAAWTGRVC